MIQVHILKDKAGDWYSVILGGNGEVLHSCEGMKNRTDLYNNISKTRQALVGCLLAEEVNIAGGFLLVQDDSKDKPVVMQLSFGGVATESNHPAGPKYIPGKNDKE